MRTFARVLLVGSMVALVGAGGGVAIAADASPAASPGAASGSSEGSAPGFATPEEAARAYLEAVAAADLDGVLATSAAPEMARGVDFVAWVDRLRAWMPFQAPLPATDPFLIDLTEAQQSSMLLTQVRTLVYGLLTDAELDGRAVLADAAWAEAFQARLDPSRLSGLAIGAIVVADPEHMADERYKEMMAKQAAVWGADDITERVAAITLEGRDAIVGFTLIRYGDTWKVMSQTSAMAGLPATGAPAFGE